MKKITMLCLVLFAFVLLTTGALADKADTDVDFNWDQPFYLSFTGEVTSISDYRGVEDTKIVSLESKDGSPANFIVGKNTFISQCADLSVGSVITGFYDATRPMIMIYPPQYSVEVITGPSGDGKDHTFVGYFDEELVSSDGKLKIHLSEDTEVLDVEGNSYAGELTNNRLLVYYSAATKSIPAQTHPSKIVLLNEPLICLTANMLVEDRQIEGKTIYLSNDSMVYVPLRAIGEELGFAMTWQGKDKEILMGDAISLTIGSIIYTTANAEEITLEHAPKLIDSTTYVPLSFFREVVLMNNAYYFEGQIVVNDGEKFN